LGAAKKRAGPTSPPLRCLYLPALPALPALPDLPALPALPDLPDLPDLFLDRGLLDVIELRERRLQVGVALRLDRALVRLLAVLIRDLLDHVHVGRHFAERREALRIEERVVLEVDEHLRRPRVFAGRGEGDVALLVAVAGGRIV